MHKKPVITCQDLDHDIYTSCHVYSVPQHQCTVSLCINKNIVHLLVPRVLEISQIYFTIRYTGPNEMIRFGVNPLKNINAFRFYTFLFIYPIVLVLHVPCMMCEYRSEKAVSPAGW